MSITKRLFYATKVWGGLLHSRSNQNRHVTRTENRFSSSFNLVENNPIRRQELIGQLSLSDGL